MRPSTGPVTVLAAGIRSSDAATPGAPTTRVQPSSDPVASIEGLVRHQVPGTAPVPPASADAVAGKQVAIDRGSSDEMASGFGPVPRASPGRAATATSSGGPRSTIQRRLDMSSTSSGGWREEGGGPQCRERRSPAAYPVVPFEAFLQEHAATSRSRCNSGTVPLR